MLPASLFRRNQSYAGEVARILRAWAYLTLAALVGSAIVLTQGWLLAIDYGH